MYGFIERHFIWILIGFSIAAISIPTAFTWLKPLIPSLLGIIMFGIGATLHRNDIKRSWNNKWIAIIAIIVKYILMPIMAYIIGISLHLPLLELVGLVIIGSCPGGTAANVMSYLSKANIVFTVAMTFGTTIIAPIFTPTLVYLLLHKHIEIHFLEIIQSMILLVFFPISTGILIKYVFHKKISKISGLFPNISIIAIALVIACVLSLTHEKIYSFEQGKIGKAIRYCLSNWNELNNFLKDGRIEIDNNLLENTIRPFALGRKNWLFMGSPEGAKAGAILYSLIETCKTHNIKPYKYLCEMLHNIRLCKTDDDYQKLLPQNIAFD